MDVIIAVGVVALLALSLAGLIAFFDRKNVRHSPKSAPEPRH